VIQGARWFERAAEHGHAGGMFNFAYLLWIGMGVERDAQQSERWYRAAAERGQADAQCNLAALLEQSGNETEAAM
jgi:TPR repeat protein